MVSTTQADRDANTIYKTYRLQYAMLVELQGLIDQERPLTWDAELEYNAIEVLKTRMEINMIEYERYEIDQLLYGMLAER